jgi:hypothetical protein
METILYMAVTTDKYELPLCVGTVHDVAEWANVAVNSVYYAIFRGSTSKNGTYKFLKIKLEGDNNEF